MATAIMGVKFGGWGIILEKTIKKIKPSGSKLSPQIFKKKFLFITTKYYN